MLCHRLLQVVGCPRVMSPSPCRQVPELEVQPENPHGASENPAHWNGHGPYLHGMANNRWGDLTHIDADLRVSTLSSTAAVRPIKRVYLLCGVLATDEDLLAADCLPEIKRLTNVMGVALSSCQRRGCLT